MSIVVAAVLSLLALLTAMIAGVGIGEGKKDEAGLTAFVACIALVIQACALWVIA